MTDLELGMLRELWTALGCAPNPDDYKPSVRVAMWGQALDMVRGQTARASRVYRENVTMQAEIERLRDGRESPISSTGAADE